MLYLKLIPKVILGIQRSIPAGFILLLLVVPSARLHACDTGTVRDTAFSSVRENFWLGMVFDESDTESQNRYNTLSDWLDEHGENLNIKVEHILPNDTMYLRLRYGVTTPPEKLPITYFSGHHPATSRSICYFDWTPAPKISLLKNLKSNAVLSAINKDTADKWGTILYARGTGSNKREEVEKVVEQWQRSHAPGITMITVDRHAPENKFICAVAGITEEGEDWVGITFAKGRILTPILVGDAITTRKLDQMLNQLTTPCTCLQEDSIFGFDLPMFWDNTENGKYVELAAPVGYMEISLDDKLASVLTEMPSGRKSINTAALTVLSVLGLIVVLMLSIMYLHLRKKH